jgi:hypothetical protein
METLRRAFRPWKGPPMVGDGKETADRPTNRRFPMRTEISPEASGVSAFAAQVSPLAVNGPYRNLLPSRCLDHQESDCGLIDFIAGTVSV